MTKSRCHSDEGADLEGKAIFISSAPPVRAQRIEDGSSTCTVNEYWQRVTNNMTVDFAWTAKGGRGTKDSARYHYGTWSHDIFFRISREIDTDLLGRTTEWARLLECRFVSIRKNRSPNQKL